MKRKISSQGTFFWIVLLPAIFVLGGTIFGIWRYSKGEGAGVFFIVAVFLIIHLAFYGRYKQVFLDDTHLYVSNFRKEIVIPLTNIYDVTENRWAKFDPVTIHLRSPSEFGDYIVFIPTYRPLVFFKGHPIVEELKALARSMSATGFLQGPSDSGGLKLP